MIFAVVCSNPPQKKLQRDRAEKRLASRAKKNDSNDRRLLKFNTCVLIALRIYIENIFFYQPILKPSPRVTIEELHTRKSRNFQSLPLISNDYLSTSNVDVPLTVMNVLAFWLATRVQGEFGQANPTLTSQKGAFTSFPGALNGTCLAQTDSSCLVCTCVPYLVNQHEL